MSLSDKIEWPDQLNGVSCLWPDDVKDTIKALKDFLNMQRKAFNDLFDVGGEYPDQRVLAHLHTCINSIDNKIEELFGGKLI